VVYFAAKHWWFIVPTVVLLARVCGLQWTDAGVLVALVSRARRRRFEKYQSDL
jgi:hypothetical protein